MQTIISENLKRLRRVKELTQRELAKLAGVSQSAISKIEAGERIPKVSIIQKLAKALGQTPENLVKGAIKRTEEGTFAWGVATGVLLVVTALMLGVGLFS